MKRFALTLVALVLLLVPTKDAHAAAPDLHLSALRVASADSPSACLAAATMQEEVLCLREWYAVLEEGVESAITMSAVIAAIESCGATLGLSCPAIAWLFRQSMKEADDFVAALIALNNCRSGGSA
jgi:hypothetical protein